MNSREAAECVSSEPNRSVNGAEVELSSGAIGVNAALRCKSGMPYEKLVAKRRKNAAHSASCGCETEKGLSSEGAKERYSTDSGWATQVLIPSPEAAL